jgi:hypothetical protein
METATTASDTTTEVAIPTADIKMVFHPHHHEMNASQLGEEEMIEDQIPDIPDRHLQITLPTMAEGPIVQMDIVLDPEIWTAILVLHRETEDHQGRISILTYRAMAVIADGEMIDRREIEMIVQETIGGEEMIGMSDDMTEIVIVTETDLTMAMTEAGAVGREVGVGVR